MRLPFVADHPLVSSTNEVRKIHPYGIFKRSDTMHRFALVESHENESETMIPYPHFLRGQTRNIRL